MSICLPKEANCFNTYAAYPAEQTAVAVRHWTEHILDVPSSNLGYLDRFLWDISVSRCDSQLKIILIHIPTYWPILIVKPTTEPSFGFSFVRDFISTLLVLQHGMIHRYKDSFCITTTNPSSSYSETVPSLVKQFCATHAFFNLFAT
jgi:hypothetical protein